ncbi:MAG: metallophosphoesterase [Epulopiscium sp.]|nr:metallophosphoesterase [Candidatus Epulonipiscium sp.]
MHSSKLPHSFAGFKVLQLTDLHSKNFGENNKRLLKKINKINPDIIVATGDMLNSRNDKGEIFLNLAAQLTQKYTLYYILGNHEQIARITANRINSNWYKEYINKLRELGVIVLEDEKAIIKKNDEQIMIYGLEIPLMYYSEAGTPMEVEFSQRYLEKYLGDIDDNDFNMLLVHTPLYYSSYVEWGADLVFSGHMHGGIIRLPFIGGVLSPERDYFPEYDAGKYQLKNSTMIVGRGLGNYTINLRVFNRPELVVIFLNR